MRQKDFIDFLLPSLLLTSSLIITALLYTPGLQGGFIFDDGPNIVENKALHLQSLSDFSTHYTDTQSGPLGRPLSYYTFALNHIYAGLEPYTYKVSNLIIHLLNGISIYILTLLLLTAYNQAHRLPHSKKRLHWIASFVATLWLIHPLGLTSVLYVVQRMNSLTAFFTIICCIFYVAGRLRQIQEQSGIWLIAIALGIFFPLGLFSKENAALIPYFLLLIELFIFAFSAPNNTIKHTLWLAYGATLVVPIVVLIFYWEQLFGWLAHAYEYQPFTLYERLLTQARVIWFYIKLIIFPQRAELGLYHDNFPLSSDLVDPLITLLAILGLVAMVAVALFSIKKAPLLGFGLSFFLVGHSMESSFLPLEIAHEHRSYLPSYGLLLAIVYYLLHPNLRQRVRFFSIVALTVFAFIFSAITWQRAIQWSNPVELAFSLAYEHPNSPRANFEAGARALHFLEYNLNHDSKDHYYNLANNFFTRAYRLEYSNPNGLFGLLYLDGLMQKPVNQEIVQTLKERLASIPISPSIRNSFYMVTQCQDKGRCLIDKERLVDLYQTALLNPRLRTRTRGYLTFDLMAIEMSRENHDRALELANQAITAYPDDIQFWFAKIYAMIVKGLMAESKDIIEQLKTKFRDSRHVEAIHHVEQYWLQQNTANTDSQSP